ncbi:MAG: Anthranilate 1,2-dioxygenase electron transfer component [Syntrophaceae bacterium PtaU1.Bin231]|nr:MAG: Anthranilate 1,2-dioxygenase electron transfer component [Syntrophaceae bacterium PtaU1.Bin231]
MARAENPGTDRLVRLIVLSAGVTLALWIGSKWYFQDWFVNPFKYPAKAASLTATTLMCWTFILSTRLRLLEGLSAGLDKMYAIHRNTGRWSFFIILLHPLFLSAHNLPDVPAFLEGLWFLRPLSIRYILGHNLGVIVLLLMAALVALTLRLRVPYHLWKRSHEAFGLVLLVVIGHIYVVDQDVAAYPLLQTWMYGLLGLAAASFLYIRFLYRFLGPHCPYAVSRIERCGDILEITFSPAGEKMDFRPGQFVYLVVSRPGISREPHPFSIASGYRLNAQFKLGIRMVGDYTRSLDRLEEGDAVTFYGPYGRFGDRFLSANRDCVFIAGGIGITPFLGMWHVALHSEERLDERDVPEPLRHFHPEILKSWKSPRVHLFYVCRDEADASFDDDIRGEIAACRSLGFGSLEERGHAYELYLSGSRDRLSAAYINGRVNGGVIDRMIFLCGPPAMMESLTRQFRDLGVPGDRIVFESYSLK